MHAPACDRLRLRVTCAERALTCVCPQVLVKTAVSALLCGTHAQAWAWGSLAVYGALCVLNVFWFTRIVAMLARKLRKGAPAARAPRGAPPMSGPR